MVGILSFLLFFFCKYFFSVNTLFYLFFFVNKYYELYIEVLVWLLSPSSLG